MTGYLKWQCASGFMRLVPKKYRFVTRDRYILEEVVFRELIVSGNYKKVLFAGCDYYTRWYSLLFDLFTDVLFATVEPHPSKARFGSKKHHTVGFFDELAGLPENKGFYDLVILNGVFGFGIDSPEDKAKAFDSAYELLKPEGRVLIGFNDVDSVQDYEITRTQCRYDFSLVDKEKFEAAFIPGLDRTDYLVQDAGRHHYICFSKRVPTPRNDAFVDSPSDDPSIGRQIVSAVR